MALAIGLCIDGFMYVIRFIKNYLHISLDLSPRYPAW